MKLFTAIYDDHRLLGHFLSHYRKVGVNEFYIAVDAQVEEAVSRLDLPADVTVVKDLNVADSFYGGNAAVSEMRRRYQDSDEWVIIADLDEFVEFPTNIDTLLGAADRAGANVVRGTMYDRFSEDGRLKDFDPDSNLSESYPIKARFIANVMDGADYKGVIVKGNLEAEIAHHTFIDETIYDEVLEISHYKWSNTSAIDRVRAAYFSLTAAGAHWTDEFERVIEHYERHGRFAWETFGGSLAVKPTGRETTIATPSV